MPPNFGEFWLEYLRPLVLRAGSRELQEMRIDSTRTLWCSMVAQNMRQLHRLSDGRVGEADIAAWTVVSTAREQVVGSLEYIARMPLN